MAIIIPKLSCITIIIFGTKINRKNHFELFIFILLGVIGLRKTTAIDKGKKNKN